MAYKIGTRNHPHVGLRVEIPPCEDMWMRGARFGTVERVIDDRAKWPCINTGVSYVPQNALIWRVRLDHPQARNKLRGYIAAGCRVLTDA